MAEFVWSLLSNSSSVSQTLSADIPGKTHSGSCESRLLSHDTEVVFITLSKMTVVMSVFLPHCLKQTCRLSLRECLKRRMTSKRI